MKTAIKALKQIIREEVVRARRKMLEEDVKNEIEQLAKLVAGNKYMMSKSPTMDPEAAMAGTSWVVRFKGTDAEMTADDFERTALESGEGWDVERVGPNAVSVVDAGFKPTHFRTIGTGY